MQSFRASLRVHVVAIAVLALPDASFCRDYVQGGAYCPILLWILFRGHRRGLACCLP